MNRKEVFSKLPRASTFGLLTGVVGLILILLPIGSSLEENFGLDWLFKLRGVQTPPSEVVIVSIDKASAETLNLPVDASQWPRSLHGRLIRILHRHGARIIAFDMLFDQRRVPEENRAMAQAMMAAQNVVLSESIKPHIINKNIYIESLVSPTALLAEAAVTTAPFPLPKANTDVKRFWTFKASVGGRATLPTAVFHLFIFHEVYDEFRQLIKSASPEYAARLPAHNKAVFRGDDLNRMTDMLKNRFRTEPGLVQQLHKTLSDWDLPNRETALLRSCLKLYQGGNSRYFNHYGPSRTIKTVPYHQVINQSFRDPDSFRDKAVFVGRSEDLQPENDRGFYSVFSEPGALTISSVELAATAFANLLTDRTLRPPRLQDQLLLIALWGFLIGLICYSLPVGRAVLSTLTLAVIYLSVVCLQFSRNDIWLPVVIPLCIQLPFAFVSTLISRYLTSNRERVTIHKALSYYIPEDVASKLAKEKHLLRLSEESRLMYGVCFATDAGNYTTLSETIDPMTLGQVMNEYYAAIFEPVRRHGGIVSDVMGDAMLAIWATPQADEATRVHACNAALELIAAVDRFNRSHSLHLPTRVGLQYGQMRLGNVGSSDHYEYRAVGDIVNSATRIEGLNKQLGTRLLVSEECLMRAGGFYTRKLGAFLLEGKSRTLVIHELLCLREDVKPEQERLCTRFSEALALFQAQRWNDALQHFSLLMLDYPHDGPSLFYKNQCQRYMEYPPDIMSANVIQINKNAPKLAI